VIGNPPYIRYQYFDSKQQENARKIYERAKLTYTKLSNAWVSFVVGASLLLKEKSKIAFVLPAELLQVSYAHEVT
jgi:adenine-specific DNA methylase